MDQPTQTPLAPPRIVKLDALLLFGLAQRCARAGDAAIPSQWNAFVPHLGHIEGQIGSVTYGAIYNAEDDGAYDYMCAVEVRAFPTNPPEFTRLRIPPQTYAVFEHRDHISAIASTWKAIWEHALADSGHQAQDAPAFERYDERFNGQTGQGGCEIWIPVKE